MQVDVLGVLRVRGDTGPREVSGSRLRGLLGQLAMAGGRPVSGGAIVEALWEGDPPSEATGALQSLVSRLRRALGDPAAVRQVAGGYLLAVEPADVDALRATSLLAQGRAALRAGAAEQAAGLLAAAAGLWRGEPAAELDPPGRARLEELRRDVLSARADAELACGRPDAVLADLQALHEGSPLDERFAGQLLRALAAGGRPAEALATYEALRGRLADELGVDPSPGLQETHLALLRAAPPPAAGSPRVRSWLTIFVGRDDELRRLAELLAAGRLVTVLGTGGAGKTRLAIEAASAYGSQQAYGDERAGLPAAVRFVELAPVTDPAEVPQAVLTVVGRRDAVLETRLQKAPREATDLLVEALGDAPSLLVLDNCEHLLDAVAVLTETLLFACPQLRVLATSREPLGIVGEVLAPLAPLAVPPADAGVQAAGRLPAVRLLVERAAAVRPDFALDESNVRDVVEVVRRLDGLPLAVELAAARLRTLPVAEVAVRLSDRFRLLTGGSRTALPRHRTLRAVVAWSWDLLTPAERLLAERVAVFPSGVTDRTAAAVCADEALPAAEVADLLDALVDKSLLEPVGDGSRRRMLETIREYGIEQLAERGELPAVRARHARHFAELVADADRRLRTAGQVEALQLLRAEHDNVMAALRELCAAGAAAPALRLALDLSWYWQLLGRHDEAKVWLGAVLAVEPAASPVEPAETDELRAAVRVMLGVALLVSSDVALAAGADPRPGLARLAADLAAYDLRSRPVIALAVPVVLVFGGDEPAGRAALEELVSSGDPWLAATARLFRARVAENDGGILAARADAEQALTGFRGLSDRWGIASTLQLIAMCRQYDGDFDGALAALQEAGRCLRALGQLDVVDELMLSLRLADLHLRRGDTAAARDAVAAGQALMAGARSREMTAVVDAVAGTLERLAGDLPAATRLQVAADEALGELGGALFGADHGLALVGSAGALLALQQGDVVAGAQRLAAAYRAGIATTDLPIVAGVGVAVAALAVAVHEHAAAAAVLGAAAVLRGADDPTNLDVRAVTTACRAALGDTGYDRSYAAGRTLDRAAAQARLDPSLLPEPVQARRL